MSDFNLTQRCGHAVCVESPTFACPGIADKIQLPLERRAFDRYHAGWRHTHESRQAIFDRAQGFWLAPQPAELRLGTLPLQPSPRIHRQKTAQYPTESQQSKYETCEVMP